MGGASWPKVLAEPLTAFSTPIRIPMFKKCFMCRIEALGVTCTGRYAEGFLQCTVANPPETFSGKPTGNFLRKPTGNFLRKPTGNLLRETPPEILSETYPEPNQIWWNHSEPTGNLVRPNQIWWNHGEPTGNLVRQTRPEPKQILWWNHREVTGNTAC